MIVKNCYAYSGFFGINGDTQIIGMTIDNALKVLESEKEDILNFADYDSTFSEKSANRYHHLNRLIKDLTYDKRMSK